MSTGWARSGGVASSSMGDPTRGSAPAIADLERGASSRVTAAGCADRRPRRKTAFRRPCFTPGAAVTDSRAVRRFALGCTESRPTSTGRCRRALSGGPSPATLPRPRSPMRRSASRCRPARGSSRCPISPVCPLVAHGTPAFGQYRPDGKPWALHVVHPSAGGITAIQSFVDTQRLFPLFVLQLHATPDGAPV